jgi:transcriptional regulator with XRE-family HTH domain
MARWNLEEAGMQREKLTPIGKRIRVGMASVGICSESDLARRIGVSHQTVRRILYEPVRVDAVTMFRISDTLKMSARWLMFGQGTPAIRLPLTPSAQRLIEIHDRLDAKGRSILLAAATQLVSA